MNSTFLYHSILIILIIQFIIESILEYMNAKKYQDPIPKELDDVFNTEEYLKSQKYKKSNYNFGKISSIFSLLLTLGFLIFGGFNFIDQFVNTITDNTILKTLFFFGIIFIGSDLLTLPLSYYQTFVIEEKYGFHFRPCEG